MCQCDLLLASSYQDSVMSTLSSQPSLLSFVSLITVLLMYVPIQRKVLGSQSRVAKIADSFLS